MPKEKFLQFIRGVIAMKNVPKKYLARKCKVSQPQFSEMIHGDRPMPHHVRERLIKELELESVLTNQNPQNAD